MMPIIRSLLYDPNRAQQQLLKVIRDEADRSGDPDELGKAISIDAINELVEMTREQRE